MIELTEPLQRAVDEGGGQPVQIVDPRDQQTYVLLSSVLYDRLQRSVADSLDMKQVSALVAQAMREDDAGDPYLESYQAYNK